MNAVEIITKKRDSLPLTKVEINYFIKGICNGSIPDYQAAALLMAGHIRGFNQTEILALTRAMVNSGEVLDLQDIPGIKVDKHSTGGVGDKTSLIIMPIIAAAGLIGAKMSGRGLGHTGGTLDKLESIPGLKTSMNVIELKRQLKDIGLAIISQTADMVPADKLLYALRDVTATVDSMPLIAASIMSKKLAVGANVLALDVKHGSGAFIKDFYQARELAIIMVDLAKNAGINTAALLTPMNQPLGCAVGNALEITEAVEVLNGRGPVDLREICLFLAGEIIYLAGLKENREHAKEYAAKLLDSGKAYDKFLDMIAAQGGETDFSKLPTAKNKIVYRAKSSGYIQGFLLRDIGYAAVLLGAGRLTKTDVIDNASGLITIAKQNTFVNAGEGIINLYFNDSNHLNEVKSLLNKAVLIGPEKVTEEPTVTEIIV